MNQIRIGVIGIGNMGSFHATNLYQGKVKDAVLTAVCDVNQSRLEWAKTAFNNEVATYLEVDKLLSSQIVDAIIIATPQIGRAHV